ncbi:fluoride efflux transporter FluC [Henriciella aquimarina]|uniref:fluoride efflux transporter FluC n=1 Tax=Henriciella aquimarina TaxID=545261 RepID=UPI000A0633C5|nr:CrcB family protein [Henriciella aquimarina]
MNGFLYVALGGALGASLRHGAGLAAMRLGLGTGWPWATFFVNLLGSLMMGLLIGFLAFRGEWLGGGQNTRLFLATGLLGGFTTFSAFSLEVARYVEEDQWGRAAAYAGISVIAGLLLVLIGMMIMRKVLA